MPAAYLAMDLTGWFVIVPLTFASLLSGLAQGLGTPWGLFRHYWILMKLVITGLCSLLLLMHMRPTGRLANAPLEMLLSSGDLRHLRIQLAVDASLALLALLVTVMLAVYKPQGMTSYGARKLQQVNRMPRWVIALAAIGIVVLFTGRMFAGHGG